MRKRLILATATFIFSSTALYAADESPKIGGKKPDSAATTSMAQEIIKDKCTKCHSDKRIKAAILSKKDMQKIQKEMERKGARLSANESQVLGIYWRQNPLKN